MSHEVPSEILEMYEAIYPEWNSSFRIKTGYYYVFRVVLKFYLETESERSSCEARSAISRRKFYFSESD